LARGLQGYGNPAVSVMAANVDSCWSQDMHGVTNIVTYLTPPPRVTGTSTPSDSGPSGPGFQTAVLARPGASFAQGTSTTASPSLGSQTVSTLLQTQDLNQTQAHGGGGGHHGGMKMTPGLEAEEEVAEVLRQRKKLTKTVKPSDTSEATEVDENGVPLTTDVEQSETDLPGKQDRLNSGT
jgi:hypothetical protein